MKAWKLELIDKLVLSIATPAPPCFEARDIWLLYLRSAIEVQSTAHRTAQGPVLRDTHGTLTGQPNPDWSFCKDCCFTPAELSQKHRLNACRPNWWRQHADAAAQPDQRVITIHPIKRAQPEKAAA